jgi:hypothetical protein
VKRKIDTAPFVKALGVLPLFDCGQAPSLRWIEISTLVVDPAYQREIGGAGAKNICRIAREFDWSQFSTAALRGHKKVPCQIISVDQRKQAAAFAAINANVTEMSSMQVHAAKVAASDVEALRLNKICAAGGVKICRYPVPASKMKVGETLAVTQLAKALVRYGEKPLRIALQAITSTRDGNPGMVRGQLVEALCAVLEPRAGWLNHPGLIVAFQAFDFKACWIAAAQEAVMSRGKTTTILTEKISAYLAATLTEKAG